jgi:hypothetical protein
MDEALCAELKRVIEREAPLHLHVLARRLLVCFELKRVTERVMERLQTLLQRSGAQLLGDIVWSAGQDPAGYDIFRAVGAHPETQRKPQEVPPEELRNAICLVLGQNLSLSLEDLSRETSRVLGFGRSAKHLESRVAEAVCLLEAQGQCRLENDKVFLNPLNALPSPSPPAAPL